MSVHWSSIDGVMAMAVADPAGIADVRIYSRSVAEQVWLPLAGVTADEAIKVLEAHSDRPLIERTGLTRAPVRNIMIFAEPRRAVAIVQKNPANARTVLADDAVVSREARRHFGDHTEAHRVVITAGE